MAVKYKIYQSKRNDRFKGRWYARAVHEGTVTTDDLADIMQDNCTVKRSDILAVISELVEVMRTQLQNSMRVKLDRFGTFKLAYPPHPPRRRRTSRRAPTSKAYTCSSSPS